MNYSMILLINLIFYNQKNYKNFIIFILIFAFLKKHADEENQINLE
jgi:hypothetical protein